MMMPPPIPNRGPPAKAAREDPRKLSAGTNGAAGVAGAQGLKLNGRTPPNRRVILEPGHSPLDWARLQRSGEDLRGLGHQRLIKVSPSLLAMHRKPPDDVWMAIDGRVYNVTKYVPFHPGGGAELLRGAGRDGTKLFNATHPWVNFEGMLGECLIGMLVPEEEAAREESELEMVD